MVKKLKREPLVDYNEVITEEGVHASISQLEMSIARELTSALVSFYPDRNWSVAVDSGNGYCAIMAASREKLLPIN